LFDIVIDVARRFRTAKEIVAEHRNYILRLKADVFKVRFGSFGVKVPVKCSPGNGRPQTRRMTWKEFCESQFGVTADWINRLCGGKAEGSGQEARSSSTPDWKTTLVSLVNALEQCGDKLPADAKDALHAAQEMLGAEGKAEATCTGPASVSESATNVTRYWLTPEDVYAGLDEEFHFDFDPCPCPKPEGFDSLKMEWGKSTYVNPPFHQWDGGGNGPTAWVRKGIEEHKKGKKVVFLLPVQSYVNLLLEAGAEVRSSGRIRWLEADTKQPSRSPSPIACFILR
jgi:hypothetical protein